MPALPAGKEGEFPALNYSLISTYKIHELSNINPFPGDEVSALGHLRMAFWTVHYFPISRRCLISSAGVLAFFLGAGLAGVSSSVSPPSASRLIT